MANYDDVIERNKRYLTKAQVNALVAASKQLSLQNAGNRANALASAREQYDTGYRGLQNMGLAGGMNAIPTSGEVPRLRKEIQAPFEAYNNQLQQVENQQLNALGEQYARRTRRARAAAAAEAAAAEAAAAKAREERRISAGLRQTDMEATGWSGSTINSDPKRQRNVNMTDTASNGEREAEAAARARAAAEATRIGAGLHQTTREAAGLSGSSLNIGQNRQRNVNMTDTGTNGERAALDYKYNQYDTPIGPPTPAEYSATKSQIDGYHRTMQMKAQAAAAALGIATNKYNDAYTRAQMEANAGKASEVPTFKVQSGSTAAADLKRTQNVGMTDTASNRNNTGSSRRYATQGTSWSSQGGQVEGPSLKEVDDAIAVYESAVKAYEDTAGHGAPSEASREPINKANELLNSLGFASIYSAKRYRDSITNTNEPERSTEEPDYLVKARREMEDAQAKFESALAGTNTLQQQLVGIVRKRGAGEQVTEQDVQNVMRSAHAAYISGSEDEKKAVIDMVMEAYGFRPYGMDDDAYKRDIQKYRYIKQAMQLLQNKDAAGGEQGAILTLQRYDLTEEQASKWLKEYTEERDRRAEYNYYRPGILAQIEHQGEKPTGPVNEEEKDQRYRDVNGLPLGSNLYTAYFADRLPDNGQYMTDEQRNVYNAIYEREGIEAANQYLDDIQPYINLQRAAQDEEYYKQLANEHPLAADALSVGQNLFGSMPAMAEKLTIGARNVIMGTEDPRYIDVNSRASRLSNAAGTIRGERTRLIQEGYYRNNATNWLHDKGLISDGMKNGLDAINKKEWVNNTLSFLYQSKMSMADSAVAMAVAWTGAPWMVDALFFSSAGNEAYKDARARGATQEEALGFSILSGTAEALFEHVSIESFMDKFVNNTPQLAQNWLTKMLAQSLTEASEETCTEIATVFADMIAMGDKSEWARAAEAGPEEFNRFLRQKAEDVGMAGLGGFISGLAFGGFGTAMNATQRSKYGKTLLKTGQADQYLQQARLLGGDQLNYAADSFEKNKSRSNAAELGIRLEERIKELNEAKTPAVSKMDAPAALTMIQDGSEMTTEMGQAVLAALDSKTIESMGYKSSTAEAFAKSYNDRLNKYQITSRSNAMARTAERIERNAQDRTDPGYAPFIAQSPSKLGKAGVTMNADGTVGTRQDETNRIAQSAEAMDRLWKDPNLGYTYTEEGARVRNLPGNMTSVSYDEQRRSNFAPRTTVTVGRTTYQIAGMETREGLSDEQKITALKKNMAKGTLARAEFLESLADALKINMVIHDELNGTGGFLDGDDTFHISLASEQSILRVTSHELMHEIRRASQEAFTAVKDSLIKQIGQDTFDRKVEQKKREYAQMGVQLDQDGAMEETVAEYSERMLSDTDWLEDFVEENPEAARTMKDVLLKIVNAVKKAFKRIENRNYGTSWSQEIEYTRDTLQAMYKGLEAVMERAEKKAEERTSRQEEAENELYMDADTQRAEQVKKVVEESAQKKTYVRGYSAAEIEHVLSAGVLGDKSNYEGNDYENARGMIAQLIPDIVSALNGEADIDEVNEKVKTAVGVMMDNYFEDEGNMAALREDIPDLIGVDATAKGDLKAQDQSLFQMSARLSKVLGKRVTLVSEKNAKGQKNAKHRIAEKLEDLWTRTQERYGLSDDMDFSLDPQRLLDFIEQQADTRKTARELFGSSLQDEIDSISSDIIDAVADMYGKKTGERFSLDTDAYREKITNDTIESIRKIGKKSINDFDSDDIKAAAPFAVQYNKTFPVKERSPFFRAWFGEWRANSTDQIGVADMPEYVPTNEFRKKNRGTYKNTDTGWDIDVSREGETNTISHSNEGRKSEYGLSGIKQLVEKAILFESEVHEHHQNNAKNDMIAFDHKLYALGQEAAGISLYRITVEEYFQDYKHPDKKRFHNLKYIEKVADFPGRRTSGGNRSGGSTKWSSSTTSYTVAELYSLVNKYDKEFTPGRKVNPALMNEDGTPKVFYHGTSESFDAFDRTKGRANMDIQGMFFSPYEIEAGGYGENVGQYYLSISSPASEAQAYNALNMFKGQNNAGVKAREYLEKLGYDGVVGYDEVIAFESTQIKSATENIGTFNKYDERYRYSLDTDALRENVQAFTQITTEALEKGMEQMKNLTPGKGLWALKDISRFLDTVSGGDKELRDTLTQVFENPHRQALKNYADGVARMQQKVLDIGARAGVCDEKGKHFDSKKSAAIQNIGEGFSNTPTTLKVKVKDADAVTVRAYDPDTGKLVVSERDYTLPELRRAYGRDMADAVWTKVYDEAQKARETGGKVGELEYGVNTRPFTITDLQSAFPEDWQKLKGAADEFRSMYDEYRRNINGMLEIVYPTANKYATVDKVIQAIEKKEKRRDTHIAETAATIESLTKKLEDVEKRLANKEGTGAAAQNLSRMRENLSRVEKQILASQKSTEEATRLDGLYESLRKTENEILSKKRTDTKEYQNLVDKSNRILERIAVIEERADERLSKKADTLRKQIEKAEAETEKRLTRQKENLENRIRETNEELEEYKDRVKDELTILGDYKAEMQNAERNGDSLSRMHRLEYREDYFHHFQEMASGVQNLKAIFTNNTDISPQIVGKSDTTKPKSRFAGWMQKRTGANYTADALNGMLRYGQLAEYKLAFDPLAAYFRDANEQIRKLDTDKTNRNSLILYIDQWTNTILGKSHILDRGMVNSGFGLRSKFFKTLDWINSRVIQNTLLWNMRSALVQISNITNAKGIVTNNLDWANGIRRWALAARGNAEMQAIMNQSTFLASRYMDNLQLTDSVFKSAKQFAGWMLGALDEVSAKATWWAAYSQYQRNPNARVIKNASRSFANAIEYADDVTRRTHSGRGVGELAPAMTSRMVNLIAPFQVEVNGTYQLLKDNVRQGNYMGILSTGVSVFLFNTVFEAIVGSTPLGFDIIRAIIDICFGIAGDDPDDDTDDYGLAQIGQRLAGEFVGSLPFAGNIVGMIGKENAKKILGEDTDATRYGNSQIGVDTIMKTWAGLSDIAGAVKDGRNLITETNFISDIDDLLSIIMPMGGKQLARTAEGVISVAKGYAGKVNSEGEEQVQFVTNKDLVHYLHAALFGKWSLTEASEYFGEERLLPKLFGAYEGPKSSMGKPVDAKAYKKALETGIDGKQYFTLLSDMKQYTTQAGKRAEMMEQGSLSPEQKAKLDTLLIVSKSSEAKAKDGVVYQKNSDGDWAVKADYNSRTWMDVAELGDKQYTYAKEAEKVGIQPDTYIRIYKDWREMSGTDKKEQAKAYLDKLGLSEKEYDFVWYTMFGYKKK